MSTLDQLGPWYTPRQAAPLLGMSIKDVQELCAAQQITHRRIRGRYTIAEADIKAFNRRHTTEARRSAA